ncbi:MAG: hypothetical protein HZB71_08090 [Betaproteobacteria bacterium]|nr:hypothetical protein [Betaproteobacteria bacterium]
MNTCYATPIEPGAPRRPVATTGRLAALALTAALALQGCANAPENRALAGAGLFAAAVSPSDDILQTYYLGVFDPTEQIPQTVYRVRVRGQANMLSRTHYASGWVPASLVDTLNSADVSKLGSAAAGSPFAGNYRNRRLVMFGPEGFREAPKDHRLVIVMGSNPEDFFNAVDSALGSIAEVQLDSDTSHLRQALLEGWVNALRQEQRLKATQDALNAK